MAPRQLINSEYSGILGKMKCSLTSNIYKPYTIWVVSTSLVIMLHGMWVRKMREVKYDRKNVRHTWPENCLNAVDENGQRNESIEVYIKTICPLHCLNLSSLPYKQHVAHHPRKSQDLICMVKVITSTYHMTEAINAPTTSPSKRTQSQAMKNFNKGKCSHKQYTGVETKSERKKNHR